MNAVSQKNILSQIVQQILGVGQPQKIILFGSRVTGLAHSESDYDLLVIENSNQPRFKRAAPYRRALKNMGVSKDILVWTPAEILEWQNVSNAFITTILREGQVLYEK